MSSQLPRIDIGLLLKLLEAENEIVNQPSTTTSVTDPVAPAPVAPIKPSKVCGCEGCKKKLALTDFSCKCGIRFCANHRLPESHKCSYDFRTAGMAQLKNDLVKVEGCKLDRV